MGFIRKFSLIDPQSTIDSITGLKDNGEFRQALKTIVKAGESKIILIVGIDEFKGINDLYSYSFGDKVLASFAKKVRASVSADVDIYRLDGDGFGLIFPDGELNKAVQCFHMLQEAAQTSVFIEENNISFTVSGGISIYINDGNDSELLYRNARMALRTAKSKGKNQLVIFSDEILMKEHFKMQILGCLRESVKKAFQGFSLRYQPLVKACDASLYGCEVLLRWENPTFPQGVSPYEFIPVLEDSGLIIEVGAWVLENAIMQCALWSKLMPDFQMSINVSSIQFEHPEFKFFVIDTLAKYDVRPSAITLELTESGKISDPKEMQHVFDFIRGQGIKIALDDFGTGYSSLSIFRILSVDQLKIDRSFLERISYDVIDQKIITQIVNLCHSMNMCVCIEGIETLEIEEIVQQFGPELLQGYYYNCPMTATEFEAFYLTNQSMQKAFAENDITNEHTQSMTYVPFRPAQPMSMKDVVDNAYAGIFQVGLDQEFTFLTCNEGYRRMLGYTAKEMDERFKNRALGFVYSEDVEYVNTEIRRQLSMGDTITIEFRVVKSNGTPIWILGTGNVVKSPHGGASLIVVIIDNDNLKKKNIKIEQEGQFNRLIESPQIDCMTGLLNKGETENQVKKLLLNAVSEQQFALCIIDIDNLKQMNHQLGHVKGDEVICEIAARISHSFGENDVVGRVGGEEFLACIPYVGEKSKIITIIEHLIIRLHQGIIIDHKEYPVSVSVGIACYPHDGTNFYDLFHRADSALYRSKEIGKGTYCFATKA
ncbi:MAG: diguanylate cyclase [Lachnospiraceae bacterium]